jgi:hypothetical protein
LLDDDTEVDLSNIFVKLVETFNGSAISVEWSSCDDERCKE